MISNQILQNTIDGLKNITRKELSVVEKEGKVIATTEENMIGRQIETVENFVISQAESQLILGYQYFKIYDNGVPEYVIQVKGEDEEGYKIGKIAAFQIQSLFWLRQGRPQLHRQYPCRFPDRFFPGRQRLYFARNRQMLL